jgi:hypothetical protein
MGGFFDLNNATNYDGTRADIYSAGQAGRLREVEGGRGSV